MLKNKELILAPWNATRFPYGNCVIWHFQGLRLIKKRSAWKVFFGFYKLPTPTKNNIYREYTQDFVDAINQLSSVGYDIRSQGELTNWQKIKEFSFSIKEILKFPVQGNLVEITLANRRLK